MWKWLFGKGEERSRGDVAQTRPQRETGSGLLRMTIEPIEQRQALLEKWKGRGHTYGPSSRPRCLEPKVQEFTLQQLENHLQRNLGTFHRNEDDPEARAASVKIENIINGGLKSATYRWGAHKIEIDIHRFGHEDYILIEKKYHDFYC